MLILAGTAGEVQVAVWSNSIYITEKLRNFDQNEATKMQL